MLSLFTACTSAAASTSGGSLPNQGPLIAVFPLQNLSGAQAPLGSLMDTLIRNLEKQGFRILDSRVLDDFMERNRIRYTAGVDENISRALRLETKADATLITSVELCDEMNPPKVSLVARLVATGDTPVVLWADGVGIAGDDSPGILGLGLIESMDVLLTKASGLLVGSLEATLRGEAVRAGRRITPGRYGPKSSYRSRVLTQGEKRTVAIAPFFNGSERKNAGDVLALQFVAGLGRSARFQVIEPGLVRNAFLNLRIVMDQGVSLSDAGLLFSFLDVDYVLTGKVTDYQDYQGLYGSAKVGFFAQLIERESRRVVWSSLSRNNGEDGVYFFDIGKINTAHKLAELMVERISERMVMR